jgi:hypothetical protein
VGVSCHLQRRSFCVEETFTNKHTFLLFGKKTPNSTPCFSTFRGGRLLWKKVKILSSSFTHIKKKLVLFLHANGAFSYISKRKEKPPIRNRGLYERLIFFFPEKRFHRMENIGFLFEDIIAEFLIFNVSVSRH